TPFDLAKGPLLRTNLIQMEDNLFTFLYTMHHSISDGGSKRVIESEFAILNQAFSESKDNPLAPLRIQYKDYSHWHIQQLSGQKLEEHQNYWLEHFKGQLPILQIPTDYSRPKIRAFEGQFIRFTLKEKLGEQLKEIAVNTGCTFFITALAVVKIFLFKYTGQQDLITGTPVAGRDHKDLHKQIGFYVNMIAIRDQLDEEQTFNQVLKNVKHNTLGAFEHQVYPFDRLVNQLNLKLDPSRNPLFDVVVTAVIQDNPPGKTTETGSTTQNTPENQEQEPVENLESGDTTGKHDLRFRFMDFGTKVVVHVQYNPMLFNKERILIMKERIVSLMENIVKNCDEKIKNMSFLAGSEKIRKKKRFQGGF
ncbi:MAG: hypothetical protein GY757_50100, partial [bacterium]|nr:hypothetical protein [bacterium]